MQTPSIFEDPKIHSLVFHKEPEKTSGPADDALNAVHNQVYANKQNIDTVFTQLNFNATNITAVRTRVAEIGAKGVFDITNLNTQIHMLNQKLDGIMAVANGNQKMIEALVRARSS